MALTMNGNFVKIFDLFLFLECIFGANIKDNLDQHEVKRIPIDPLKSYPEDIRHFLPASSETNASSRFSVTGLSHADLDKISQLSKNHTICLSCNIATFDFFHRDCRNDVIICNAGSVCMNASIVSDPRHGHDPQFITPHAGYYPYKGCCNPRDIHCHSTSRLVHTCPTTANCTTSGYYEIAVCKGSLCNFHDVSEIVPLKSAIAPVNGNWGTWGAWSTCMCNVKTHNRSRHCNNPEPAKGGADCVGVGYEQASCADQCQVNGNWGTWGAWSTCMCNVKTHNRSRHCNNPEPARGGADCVGVGYEQASCADQCQGQWTAWNTWTGCSSTCGEGRRARLRLCLLPDSITKTNNCPGSSIEPGTCRNSPCPTTTPVPTTVLTTTPLTTTTVGPGVWTDWTQWSACSTSCGSGFRYTARFCIDSRTEIEKHDCPGPAVESMNCDVNICPVDGSWSEWNGWVRCHRGLQYRSRECNNPFPLHNGTYCPGKNVDVINCTEDTAITTISPHIQLVPPEIFGPNETDVGANITLLCLTSLPGLTVTWFYQERDSLPLGVRQPNGTNELIVDGVNSTNYGKYTCALSDSSHSVKNQVFINLRQSAPVILSLIKIPDTVAGNSPVKLKCDVLGFPDPVIRWGYKDSSGNAFVPPPVSYKYGGKEIDIDSFQSNLYGGTWTCNAINKLGSDHRDIIV